MGIRLHIFHLFHVQSRMNSHRLCGAPPVITADCVCVTRVVTERPWGLDTCVIDRILKRDQLEDRPRNCAARDIV